MVSNKPKNRKALLRHFDLLPAEIKPHFEHFKVLAETLPLEVCLAYLFSRVELAHRDTLYCGVVKVHRADAEVARKAIQGQRIRRQDFPGLFRSLFDSPFPPNIESSLKAAEGIRDRAIHGSEPNEAEMRSAVVEVLNYSAAFDSHVKSIAGFHPFGDLRGFHLNGRGKPLGKATTRLVLRGIGLGKKSPSPISDPNELF